VERFNGKRIGAKVVSSTVHKAAGHVASTFGTISNQAFIRGSAQLHPFAKDLFKPVASITKRQQAIAKLLRGMFRLRGVAHAVTHDTSRNHRRASDRASFAMVMQVYRSADGQNEIIALPESSFATRTSESYL
jgi:hypothetical protein